MSDFLSFALYAQSKKWSKQKTNEDLDYIRQEARNIFEKYIPNPTSKAQLFLTREKLKDQAFQ